MRKKLVSKFRLGSKLLKVFETTKGMRGELYTFKFENGKQVGLTLLNSADFYDKEAHEYCVRYYFGMGFAAATNSDKYIDVNRRVIWSNNDYDEWKACMMEDNADDDDMTYPAYAASRDDDLDDERCNLNVEVNGLIIGFANLGLWDGRSIGVRTFGSNVKNILKSDADLVTWYCDRYNVLCDAIHHDGTNYYTYRVCKDKADAVSLMNKLSKFDDVNKAREFFISHTKSLRPYVANVYGW